MPSSASADLGAPAPPGGPTRPARVRADRARARRRAELHGPGALVLALDTATRAEAIALVRGDRVLFSLLRRGERGASAVLLPELAGALSALGLAFADLDAVAVCRGPGSFTGVRVGIATALGVADGAGCPVYAFTSLEARAAALPFAAHPVCALLDARKGEAYGALYDLGSGLPRPLLAPAVDAPARMVAAVARAVAGPVIVVGDGAAAFEAEVRAGLGDRARPWPLAGELPAASTLASVAARRVAAGDRPAPDEVRPLYLRPSDAERAASVVTDAG